MNNFTKHDAGIQHSRYHVPVILNGKKAMEVNLIPDGPNGPTKPKVPDVIYEQFDVITVARRATNEVEKIVQEFTKYY